MKIEKLIPGIEVWFLYQDKITHGIFIDVNRTNAGTPTKKKSRIVEIINKHNKPVKIYIDKETLFFNNEEEVIEYVKQLDEERKKQQEKEKQNEINIEMELQKYKESLKIILSKIGNEIVNCNELSTEDINNITENISEWKEYKKNNCVDDYKFILDEIVYDMMTYIDKDKGFYIKLKDGSEWLLTRRNYKCILHPLFPRDYTDDFIFKSIDSNLFKCDECGTFCKLQTDILSRYEYLSEYANTWLFPMNWSEQKITEWCNKIETKEENYYNDRSRINDAKEEYLENEKREWCESCPDWDDEGEYCTRLEECSYVRNNFSF